jgi:RNA recognition motif-containing protein
LAAAPVASAGICVLSGINQSNSDVGWLGHLEKGQKIMATKLYVGNLTYEVDNNGLEQMFSSFGEVRSAQVVVDRDTGRSKGFGFVEFGDAQSANVAITAMNGKDVGGRALTVNEARPREERGGSRSGGYGGRRY